MSRDCIEISAKIPPGADGVTIHVEPEWDLGGPFILKVPPGFSGELTLTITPNKPEPEALPSNSDPDKATVGT